MGTVEPGESRWTPEHLRRLFAAMKRIIPKHEKRVKYDRSLKTLDWKRVAFPPFSPEACQIKWSAILQKMRKIRSLTELLDEAEEFISTPLERSEVKLHPQAPKKPMAPSSMYFGENHANLRKQHPELESKMLFKLALRQYKNLPRHEKEFYKDKFNLAFKDYKSKMDRFRREYVVKKKTKATKAARETVVNDEEDLRLQPPSGGDGAAGQRSHKGGEDGVDQGQRAPRRQSLSETEHQDGEQRQEISNRASQTTTFYENAVGILEEQKMSRVKTEPVSGTMLSETEDEDVEDSSSEDEPNYVNFNEDEEEEEDDTEDDILL